MATIEEEASEGLSLLVVGQDLARVDAFVSPLRRAAYAVTRVLLVPHAVKLARENAFDLVALILPLRSGWDLVKTVRADDSACKRTALVVIADESLLPEIAQLMMPRVNRLLSAETRPEDLLATVDQLLHAAPRVNVFATARLHFGPLGSDSRIFAVENVSSTGMLLLGADPPAVGTILGFELLVSSIGAPIRGQAQLVRLTAGKKRGEEGMAMNFVSFGGEGAKQLEKLVSKERAASGAPEWRATKGGGGGGTVRIKNLEQLAARREELEELEPYLDELLAQGLVPRVKVADWYVAAAELGMESLRAFSAILEAVHSGKARRSDVSQQLVDLTDVRRGLGDFAGPKQTVESRIRILLGMRRSLGRDLGAESLGDDRSPEPEAGQQGER